MRSPAVSAALAAAFLLAPVVGGYAPCWSQSQDFSITNQEPVGTSPFRRDLMRQLQAWWEGHAYYPKHASNNDEGGTVKVRLKIFPSGTIFMVTLVESSGSQALDAAGLAAFRTGAVKPFPENEPEVILDLPLHYVLAHRHGETLPVGYNSKPFRGAFTITNDPVKSPILDTMVQRTCTGTITRNGGMSQPWRGYRSNATLVFFFERDGTPWVKYDGLGNSAVSPVTQIGSMLQWVGPLEAAPGTSFINARHHIYTVWADGPDHLRGAEGSPIPNPTGAAHATGLGGAVDLLCGAAVPTVTYSNLLVQTQVAFTGDPP
jgi:TonB family protein